MAQLCFSATRTATSQPTSYDDPRSRATSFAGRVARFDPKELIRIEPDDDGVALWARSAFGVLTSQYVRVPLTGGPVTVYAVELVAALAVSTADDVDPGEDVSDQWHAQLPPTAQWSHIGSLDVGMIKDKVAAGTATAQQETAVEQANNPKPSTKATVSPRLLDSVMMTVTDGQAEVPVPLRLLFGVSGMGLIDGVSEPVDVAVTSTWMRLSTVNGAVFRRRLANLPVLNNT